MVLAILEGRKTQTRRMVKPNVVDWFPALSSMSAASNPNNKFCNYGYPGDRLWVRESFVPNYFDDRRPAYKADWTTAAAEILTQPKWKPSIHMPRSACRILLEITAIRAELLQDISESDAIAEGIDPQSSGSFSSLWASLHGTESWDVNPWAWVISLHRL